MCYYEPGMSDEKSLEKKSKKHNGGRELFWILQWNGIAFTQFSSLLLPLHVFCESVKLQRNVMMTMITTQNHQSFFIPKKYL